MYRNSDYYLSETSFITYFAINAIVEFERKEKACKT